MRKLRERNGIEIMKNKLIRTKFFVLLMSTMMMLSACGTSVDNMDYGSTDTTVQESVEQEEISVDDVDSVAEDTISVTDIPAYTGEPYVVLNNNVPYFTEEELTTESYEYYSELDALGRCGVTHACIGQDIMPTEERGSISHVNPTGWHTVKYDVVSGKYLYNRSHLIGHQLTGEDANEKNLITGTRYFNVQGMLPFEDLIDEYVEQTNSHVLYRVTPIYEGNNLLASGAEMEAWSVEDNGKGVCFHVYVYNVQPGVGISYKDGESWLEEEQSEVSKNEEEKSNQKIVSKKAISKETISETEKEQTYILNKNTKKIHYASCRCIEDMSEQNKEEYIGTRSEILNQGYDACGVCKP